MHGPLDVKKCYYPFIWKIRTLSGWLWKVGLFYGTIFHLITCVLLPDDDRIERPKMSCCVCVDRVLNDELPQQNDVA
jgi:hypothetical protein